MSATPPPADDLPPRTWRSWWCELPGWLRIGLTAFVMAMGLQIAIGVRIVIGLHEANEIAKMRTLEGSRLDYAWDIEPEEWKRLITAGVLGRSGSYLEEVVLFQPDRDDLKFLGTECQNLVELELWGAEGESSDFLPLAGCVKLQNLRISCCDLDDRAAGIFTEMKELRELNLSQTLVSDGVLAVLKDLPSLKFLHLNFTDITASAAESWRKDPATSRISLLMVPDDTVVGSIRWSDGQRSAGFPGPYTIRVEPPWILPDQKPLEFTIDLNLDRMMMSWNPNQPSRFRDGEHRLFLKLRDYQAEPVVIHVKDGVPSTNRIEYRMPVTKAEALRGMSSPP